MKAFDFQLVSFQLIDFYNVFIDKTVIWLFDKSLTTLKLFWGSSNKFLFPPAQKDLNRDVITMRLVLLAGSEQNIQPLFWIQTSWTGERSCAEYLCLLPYSSRYLWLRTRTQPQLWGDNARAIVARRMAQKQNHAARNGTVCRTCSHFMNDYWIRSYFCRSTRCKRAAEPVSMRVTKCTQLLDAQKSKKSISRFFPGEISECSVQSLAFEMLRWNQSVKQCILVQIWCSDLTGLNPKRSPRKHWIWSLGLFVRFPLDCCWFFVDRGPEFQLSSVKVWDPAAPFWTHHYAFVIQSGSRVTRAVRVTPLWTPVVTTVGAPRTCVTVRLCSGRRGQHSWHWKVVDKNSVLALHFQPRNSFKYLARALFCWEPNADNCAEWTD